MLTITFVTESYLNIALNWLRAVEQTGYSDEIRFYTFGDLSRKFPRGTAIPLKGDFSSLEKIWIMRTRVFQELISSNTPFIHSDVDAIWLQNPLSELSKIKSPLIFSQGTFHPEAIYIRFNYVFCCGFFAVTDTGDFHVREIFSSLPEACIEIGDDDQNALNQLLYEKIIDLSDSYDASIEIANRSFFTSERHLEFCLKSTRLPFLTLLTHNKFPRIYSEEMRSQSVVAHPLTSKIAQEKEIELRKLGLWFYE